MSSIMNQIPIIKKMSANIKKDLAHSLDMDSTIDSFVCPISPSIHTLLMLYILVCDLDTQLPNLINRYMNMMMKITASIINSCIQFNQLDIKVKENI